MKNIHDLIDFLDKLEERGIYYRLSKNNTEYIMVEVSLPGERWEVEFSLDDIRIEKFRSGGLFDASEIAVLFGK